MRYLSYILLAGLILLIVGCGVSTEDIDATDEVSATKETAEIVNTATPLPATATATATATVIKPSDEFGLGGLVKNLESWADVELPKFITASHVKISDTAYVSKFRSSAGHDFSDSFEGCCSMKHYFVAIDFYGTRFTQPIYSPVDGVVLYLSEPSGGSSDDWKIEYREQTGKEPPADYRDWNIYIRPDNAPNVWITHMHVNPLDEIIEKVSPTNGQNMMMGVSRPAAEGYRVKSGDLIGYGLAEIIVKRHLDGPGIPSGCNSTDSRQGRASKSPGCSATVQLHSIFEFMTDDLFSEYQKITNVSKSDFIITAEERASNPLVCEGENFANRGNTNNPEVYVSLQGSPSNIETTSSESSSNNGSSPKTEVAATLPGFQALASGRDIIASFESSDSHLLSKFDADQSYLLVIASAGGPITVLVGDSYKKRNIYSRPLGNGVTAYETGRMDAGQIEVSVETNEDIAWQIIAVKIE